jgi:magnesium-protoporphyrin O-methyltransferase
MIDCCSLEGTNRFFSKSASYYAMRFRVRGLDRPQRLLMNGLRREGFIGKSVLEVGCGVGGLHLTLLRQGARSAIGVEASKGMLEKAMELALELGLEGMVRYQQGDFVDCSAVLPPASIVVMDKVLCCYADPLRLVKTAAAHCTGLLALTYPRNSLLARTAFRIGARIGALWNSSFHPFYHDPDILHRTVVGEGFSEVFAETTLIWQIGIYRRVGGLEASLRAEPELVATF